MFLPRALPVTLLSWPRKVRCGDSYLLQQNATATEPHQPGGTSVGITDCRVYANPLYGHVCKPVNKTFTRQMIRIVYSLLFVLHAILRED